ncbi:MAG TPA: cytochrome c oxidase subunit II [Gemmatimonadaceae bacterium]|nr:cytochrome c oxidase subunit II [Gemmatimonadaceae bacterium]
MTRNLRPRHVATAFVLLLPVLLGACGGAYPNSTFTNLTEFNRDLTSLWNVMIGWGTFVFLFVELLLVYAIWRYRRRPGGPEPEHVHGNTKLEIAWTLLPAVILVFIAVPTVRTIWKYQSGAPEGALQVDVIGHQWWWEFRYPQYDIVTANELYLPTNRAVNFSLRTADVIHSFWIPQLGGKRDLVSNRTNYLWFTPDSTGAMAFNGSCNEYCGTSHANMRFRAFTVAPEDFERWAAHQRGNAVFPAAATTPGTPGSSTGAAMAAIVPQSQDSSAAAAPAASPGFVFPQDRLPVHVTPQTAIPSTVSFPENLLAAGDAQRGFELYSRSLCIGCHRIQGNARSQARTGPDLTHVASRLTIGAGLFPNDARHLAHWIKNARAMKPGVLMPTVGVNQYDPVLKTNVVQAAGLTDEQIADIVAYLMTLK